MLNNICILHKLFDHLKLDDTKNCRELSDKEGSFRKREKPHQTR